MSYPELDRTQLKILPLAKRAHKMTVADIYPLDAKTPPYENENLRIVANRMIRAHGAGKQVIWLMGAHVLRRGNSRYIIDLMERGVLTHVATNGAGAIHDFELALIGATLEDVERYIRDGKFGNWEETGRYINEAIIRGYDDGLGYGEAIGRLIQEEESGIRFAFQEISVFAAAYRLGVPITVHKGIGYDIIDQHPSADYAAMGHTTGKDFLRFAHSVSQLENGVFLNLGSAVMGPEVYLKSLSMARNIAAQRGEPIRHFTTANFDLIDFPDFREEGKPTEAHYYHRPKKTILVRTVTDGGESYHIPGDFDRTVPKLYRLITSDNA
ncbi:MAG: hypothetical protein O7E52_25225 [Candidatus Poribacteria bacterium]|nr:hypothetical protein [Candidatus Poribacteria bacterium]